MSSNTGISRRTSTRPSWSVATVQKMGSKEGGDVREREAAFKYTEEEKERAAEIGQVSDNGIEGLLPCQDQSLRTFNSLDGGNG